MKNISAIMPKYSDREPSNRSEAKFFQQASKAGYTVFRKGWPDFLIKKDDKVYAVEVKPWGKKQTKAQKEVMSILVQLGIKCFLWTPILGFRKYTEHPAPRRKITGLKKEKKFIKYKSTKELGPILQWGERVN